jgi:hypothetical protein
MAMRESGLVMGLFQRRGSSGGTRSGFALPRCAIKAPRVADLAGESPANRGVQTARRGRQGCPDRLRASLMARFRRWGLSMPPMTKAAVGPPWRLPGVRVPAHLTGEGLQDRTRPSTVQPEAMPNPEAAARRATGSIADLGPVACHVFHRSLMAAIEE